jgi:radical SAM superfamily enzyme YgiQ (UPF0313 family)
MNITLVCHKYGVPLNDPAIYPLGFMYVSSLLKARGHNVKVLNYNLFDYKLEDEIQDQQIVMFTGFEEFKQSIIRDAKVCHEKGITTVLGGALATFCEDEMKQYVSRICVGEYDKELNIDKVPYPDYDGFQVEEYFRRNSVRHMCVLTTRGCPFNCTFCAQTCKFRVRKLRHVFKEVDLYREKYKVELLLFMDNTLNFSKSRYLRICEEMKKRKLTWGGAIRCDKFDDEMAKATKESYCNNLVIGIESFNQEKLNKMNKQLSVVDIYKTLDLMEKYKINYNGNVLVGFEDESYESIVEDIAKIPSNAIFPTLVKPFVGTKNGKTRLITKREEDFLNESFKEYIYANEKYIYPELPV